MDERPCPRCAIVGLDFPVHMSKNQASRERLIQDSRNHDASDCIRHLAGRIATLYALTANAA